MVPMDRQKSSEHTGDRGVFWAHSGGAQSRAGGDGECSRCVRFHGHVEGRRVRCAKPILQLAPHEVLCVDNIARQQHAPSYRKGMGYLG